MSQFTGDKVFLTATTDAQRQIDALLAVNLEPILLRQESVEHIQKAIEAGTHPTTVPTLAAIATAIAAFLP